jgi:hypothetical protein
MWDVDCLLHHDFFFLILLWFSMLKMDTESSAYLLWRLLKVLICLCWKIKKRTSGSPRSYVYLFTKKGKRLKDFNGMFIFLINYYIKSIKAQTRKNKYWFHISFFIFLSTKNWKYCFQSEKLKKFYWSSFSQ